MLLEINNLTVAYSGIEAVKDISFRLNENEIVGIVGESGSGKSTLLRSIIGLMDPNAEILNGEILLQGKDLVLERAENLRRVRGKTVATIFQYPEQSLDPLVKIKDAYYECVRLHDGRVRRADTEKRMYELLRSLNFSDVERVAEAYPFELSGGMCQRATIGMAMMNNPKLLLADEPTSALDVNSQLHVVEELLSIRREYHTAILLVTHNMGLVAKMADKIGVMLDGHMVEFGLRDELLSSPMHVYTKALIGSVPKMDCSMPQLIRFEPSPECECEREFCSDHHWYLREKCDNPGSIFVGRSQSKNEENNDFRGLGALQDIQKEKLHGGGCK